VNGLSGSDRFLLGVFGALTSFAGMLVILLERLPETVRAAGGITLVAAGAVTLYTAARAVTVPYDGPVRVSPRTLLVLERLYLVPLLLAAVVATALTVIDADLWLPVRVPLVLLTGGLVVGLGFLVFKPDPLPERFHTGENVQE
jgi:hypothetical protein